VSFFVLDEDHSVQEVDMHTWVQAMEARRTQVPDPWKVDETFVRTPGGPVRVSTVFLGLEHIGGIFETMAFRDETYEDIDQERCWSWDEAVKQHETMVAALQEGHRP
jgi:hypothetical protein